MELGVGIVGWVLAVLLGIWVGALWRACWSLRRFVKGLLETNADLSRELEDVRFKLLAFQAWEEGIKGEEGS